MRPEILALPGSPLWVPIQDGAGQRFTSSSLSVIWLLSGISTVLMASTLILLFLFRRRFVARTLLQKRDSSLRVLSEVARRTTNPVVITNAAGEIEWTNQAFEELSGWSLAEAVGHRPSQLVHGPGTDPESKRFMHEAVSQGRGFTRDVVNYHRSGRPYVVSLDVQPIRHEDGRLEHFISVAVDVTSRYTTEQQLRETLRTAKTAVAEKYSFLAMMSHPLRTPLNAVLGGSALLDRTTLTEDQQRYLSLVVEGAERGLLQIDNLLTLSALEVGDGSLSFSATDLPRLVESLHDTCSMLPTETTLEITVSSAIPRQVSVDGPRLRQLLVNVLNHVGSSLRAETIQVSVHPGITEGMVVMEVLSPVEEEDPAQLAELFSTTRTNTPLRHGQEPLTALGLRTSAVIARHLGGRLEADVVPGKGTIVRAVLPLPTLTTLPEDPQEEGLGRQDLSGLSILIVDDDAVSRAVLRELLHQLGNDPAEATDGVEALERLTETRYDVLLIDIDMPRMDGVELISVLRSGRTGYSDCVAIAVTANALPEDHRRLLTAGMNGYLAKPVRLNDLWEEIRRSLRTDRPEPTSTTVSSGKTAEPSDGTWTAAAGAASAPIGDLDDTVPMVDLDTLSQSLGISPEEGLLDIVGLFVEDGHRRLAVLTQQKEEHDLAGMRATAHALKGASANVHAERIHHYAVAVEELARSDQLPPTPLMEGLTTELSELSTWLSNMTTVDQHSGSRP